MTKTNSPRSDRRISVAPMMGRTDRHDRYFLRQITRRALLYTEMLATGEVLHADPERSLAFHPAERPLALQLGGSEPAELAAAARLGASFGYDEINLNIGCPSDRVQRGRFGACLMVEPERVAEGLRAMGEAVTVPVTVKTRIGVDEHDSYDFLSRFVGAVAAAGCRTVIVHARKAYLKGLSPKENRSVPPLRYDVVYRLKADFPDLEIVLNGGVETLEAAEAHLAHVDGVMIGRAAYQNPYLLAGVDRRFFDETEPPPSREAVLEAMLPYLEAEVEKGIPLARMTRHLFGLFTGMPGARLWRQHLTEHAARPGAGVDVVRDAFRTITLARVSTPDLDVGPMMASVRMVGARR
ncbi:MAG: tRNA dihydrouridine(20/20a) synthase DusA [Alphaproteobacteria bacterium]|nr:tRNA dihydrouridine(20/20a) synthase DusA [Alphaproteobacteria bacterium]